MPRAVTPDPHAPRWRSVTETAAYLSVNTATVHAFIDAGELEAFDVSTVPGRRHWRISQAAIDSFIAKRTVGAA